PAPAGPITIEIGGTRKTAPVQFDVDLLGGQKTGFYLDQKANYEIVAQHATGRRILDCFANEGACPLACGRAGAADVAAVEERPDNIAAGKHHAARNGLKVRWIEQDVFA